MGERELIETQEEKNLEVARVLSEAIYKTLERRETLIRELKLANVSLKSEIVDLHKRINLNTRTVKVYRYTNKNKKTKKAKKKK